jgi:hypothetical protein
VAGGVVSVGAVLTSMRRLFVASTLPAVSQARYLTVVVVVTVNGPL